MNGDEKVLPPDVNLVRYDNPELVINTRAETSIDQVKKKSSINRMYNYIICVDQKLKRR